MAISGILSTAISGLTLASSRLAVSADNIVNANTRGYRAKEVSASTIVTKRNTTAGYASGGVSGAVRTAVGQPAAGGGSNVDIATELVTMIRAENAYKAGVEVIRTGTRLSKVLLNIKA